MKRVVLASPTYGSIIPEAKTSQLAAVMFAAKHGIIEWGGNASSDRRGWEEARNGPVREVKIDPDFDGIMWIDSDMQVPQTAFAALVEYGHDLVSALYFQREPPYWPVAYGTEDGGKTFARLKDYPEKKIVPIGAFGFGCCYTSTDLLRMLPDDPFKFGKLSEDITFCQKSIEVGIQPYLDTGILCDHYIGPRWATEKSYKRYKKVLLSEKGEITKEK